MIPADASMLLRMRKDARRGLLGAMALPAWFAIGLLVAVVPSWAEDAWRAPTSARSRRNPLPSSSAAAGQSLFATHCAACHGTAGRGDGLAAAALNPRPRDLTSPAVQRDPDGALFWKISNGRGAMPAWSWLSEKERWALVWLIRDLGRAAANPQ